MNQFGYFWVRNKITGKLTIVHVESNGEVWFFGNDMTGSAEELLEDYDLIAEIEKPKA